ncbi:MAG: YfiR family protein [Methylophilaceae bacterium]|nr:YfiR family protein [Methylophilaceae bacterium]
MMLPRIPMLVIVLVLVNLIALPADAGDNTKEYRIKAAFIYNFFKFVEWPSTAASRTTWNLCVAGTDPFGDALDAIDGRMAQGKPVQILREVKGEALKGCHMVFTAEKEAAKLQSMLHQVSTSAVLTVGEGAMFTENGGMVGLLLLNEKLVFEVNLEPAQRTGIRFGAQLLRLAQSVKGVQR